MKLRATAGDPHDAPLAWVMAFNRESRPMKSAGNLVQSMIPGQTDPLSWIGDSLAVWVEDDPFWDELAKMKNEHEREKFFEENFARLPIAVQIGVSSRIKLAAFLVAMRRNNRADGPRHGKLGVAQLSRSKLRESDAHRTS